MFQFAKLAKHGKSWQSMVRAFVAERIIAIWQLFLLLLLLASLQSLQKLSFHNHHHHHHHHHYHHHHHQHHHILIQARVDQWCHLAATAPNDQCHAKHIIVAIAIIIIVIIIMAVFIPSPQLCEQLIYMTNSLMNAEHLASAISHIYHVYHVFTSYLKDDN